MKQIVLRAGAVALVLLYLIDASVAQESEPTTPPVAGALRQDDNSSKKKPDNEVLPVIIPALLESQLIAPEIPLSLKETEAVTLSEDWKDKYVPAILGRNGQVIYHFGESIAAIVAAPNNVTDIELEPGEVIVPKGIFVGDSINWNVSPQAQIVNNKIVTHIVVKPFYANLATTMTILTNRRTYYFYLHSTSKRFMTSVAFNYPDNFKASFSAYQQQVVRAQAENIALAAFAVPSPTGAGVVDVPADTLDFKFRISGDTPPWTPIRVYSDKAKTYIQMPRRMRHAEAPVFLALGESGDRQLVNYRVQGDTYVIDALISAAVLFSGIGGKQSTVRIDYAGED